MLWQNRRCLFFAISLTGLMLALNLAGKRNNLSQAQIPDQAGKSVVPQKTARPGGIRTPPDSSLPVDGGKVTPATRDELWPPSGLIEVIVELDDPPVGTVYHFARTFLRLPDARANIVAETYRAQIEATQQALLAYLTGPEINATVIARSQLTLNGITIRVDASKLVSIREYPGVKAVYRTKPGQTTDPVDPQKPFSPRTPGQPVD